MIKKLIHRAICWYLGKCGGSFHTYPYGEQGRYVVLITEANYHRYKNYEGALCQDCLVKIIEDMEGMEFNEKMLIKDCERLRRELDDEMGIMR